MTIIEAFILGVVQGLTEFLPVSSSGHLAFFKIAMGIKVENPLAFDIALHIGTILAVIAFMFREILARLRSKDEIYKLAIAFLATVPIALVLENFARKAEESLVILSISFFVGSIIILLSSFSFKINLRKFLVFVLIGVAQGVAAVPGISRSGSTISASLILGLTPQEAFNFSFILSLPTIISAAGYEFLKMLFEGNRFFEDIGISSIIVGVASAFVSGLIALFILRKIVVQKRKFWIFGLYKLLMSFVSLIFYLIG